ncbi:MAG TPA: ATP-dependent helicase, partial [Candidatus Saccharimonadales bacterium]|nr:ATP-dependent helicase [Candidatus Saccharimonadales bacterium]
MVSFSLLKKQLNPEQLEAVEAIEGPVLVLAGPGTGKTQVVALRIAEILQRTQVSPRNILALTFTDAGAKALRTRLEQIIGIEAFQVAVNTFHGFAGEVIASFPHVFQKTRELVPLTEADQFQLIEKLLTDRADWPMLRPLRAPTLHVRDIASRITVCKREAVEPLSLTKWALAEKKAAKGEKSAIKQDQRLAQASRLEEFASFFGAYQEKLEQTARYDYDDTILFVIEALRQNAEVRAYFQEKYQYLLVDEYQDTNNAQNTLIELLADFFPNPNLFVVGDDKQAIYRFQGASVANLLRFTQKFPMTKTIQLKINYRSTPEIIAAATKVIAQRHVKLNQFVK